MIGTRIAHYEIIEKIGEGGMGVVYRAWDRRLLRSVALKTLFLSAFSERQERRFLREAQVASAVPHPGIVTVYDYVASQEQQVIVMEYVPGSSLRQNMAQGALPWRTAVRYALRIAEALEAAHTAGIIHCDLKPENVMVTPAEQLKVLDFGIASLGKRKVIEGLATWTSSQDSQRALLGTLLYMSPEQTLGEALDYRSDIFSFGVLLHEMLTGKRPFQGTSVPAYLHDLHYAKRRPLAIQHEIPPRLVELVEACLERQRSRRPQNMRAVIRQLRTVQETSAVISHLELPATDSPSRFGSGLHRLRLAVLAISLLIIASSIVTWPRAGAPLNEARPHARLSSSQDPIFRLYRQAWEDLKRFERPGRLDRAIHAFERVASSGQMQAAAYAGLAKAYWRRYRWQSHDRYWLDRAGWMARRAVELDGYLCSARISLALVELENHDIAAAREHLKHALRLDPENEEAFFATARLHLLDGDFEAGLQAFKAAQAAGKDDRELYDLWGTLYYRSGRYAEAAEVYQKSIDRAPDGAVGYRNLAAAYFKLERYGEAATELQRALAIEPSTDLYANLGTLYFYQGLYAESAEAQRKSLELPGSTHQYLNWGNYADALRQIPGRESDANDAYRQALQLLEDKLGEADTLNAIDRSRRSLYLARKGETQRALKELERLEEKAWRMPEVLYRAAIVQELAGHRETALVTLVKAYEAGHPESEAQREPDFLKLRDDFRYHQLKLTLDRS